MSKKGRYVVKNHKKYKGNPYSIIYRSSWEEHFMKWCDSTPNILEWKSEPFYIPYICSTDNKPHKYYPDFYFKMKTKDGQLIEYVIEVKPLKQTKPPKKGKNKKTFIYESLTWKRNKSKWAYAKRFCNKRNIHFRIITEAELNLPK